MDEIQVLSNKNGNFSWWRPGPAEETSAELNAPSAYTELRNKQFFSTTHPGLFLFCTQSGQSCCLACGIPSGLIAGVVVQDNILIIGSDKNITPAMRGLASLYLADPAPPGETSALEIDPPPSLGPLVALIQRQGRDVKVEWAAMEARLREAGLATGGPPEDRFLRRDTPGARQHLAELIAGTSSMKPGEVLVAVSSGLFPGQLAEYGVRWALTDDETQGWESPLETPAPPPLRASTGETYFPPPIQKRRDGPNWLLWAFYASLILTGAAALVSIGWKRR